MQPQHKQNVSITANGNPGINGNPGSPGHYGHRPGGDGGRGGNASTPTEGQAGGSCLLEIHSATSHSSIEQSHLLLRGHERPTHQKEQPFQHTIHESQLGNILIEAVGGRGGKGAYGGPGGDGARGSKGADATRYSSGGNGGRGGDGGDGGLGTSGARGGQGGQCTVALEESNMFALMAIERSERTTSLVHGGAGGHRGQHGPGGVGGPGGPGGSSYSWTETEYYTDNEGNQQSRTTYHSNPGGSSGPRGSNGWTPTAPLHHGDAGNDGVFKFVVKKPDGTSLIYRDRYDLEVSSFSIQEDPREDLDGIMEFGEIIHITNLTLKNIGGMPTPPHQRVRVIIKPSTWIRPLDMELFLDHSIQPDEEYTIPGTLAFQIPLPTIQGPGEPFIARDTVEPIMIQLGPEPPYTLARDAPFQRIYQNSTFTLPLVAQFPIENRQGIIGLRSLAPGETTSLFIDIANISNSDIGIHAPRERRVGIQIELAQSEGTTLDDFIFQTPTGDTIDLSSQTDEFNGYFGEIPIIKTHASAHAEFNFGFTKSAPPYSSVTLRASIWIEEFHNKGAWRLVQQRVATFRAEPAYRYTPGANILLVTNNNTSRQAFLAWSTLLHDHLELPFDHWSLARYGHFDQGLDLDDGTNLRVQMEDRIALILNNKFQPRGKEKESDLPTDYIKGADVRYGATSNNTHFLMIGSPEFQAKQLLEPSSDFRRHGDNFPDIKRFILKEEKSVGTFEEETFKDDITMTWDDVQMHDWTFFTRPDREKRKVMMRKQSTKLMKKLSAMHPHRRYVIVEHNSDGAERDGRSWLVFPRWNLGKVEVRRSLNIDTTSTIVFHVDDHRLNDPKFILSPQTRYAILLALPFELKLSRLNVLLQSSQPYEGDIELTGLALIRAIMTDLSEEQAALMLGSGSLDDEKLKQKLANLGRLTREPLHTHLSFGDEKWELLFELCASLDAIADTTPWWKLWGRQRKLNRYVQKTIEAWKSMLFNAYALDPDNDVAMDGDSAKQIYAQRTDALLESFKEKQKDLKESMGLRVDLATVARDHFEHPTFMESKIQRDIDVWKDTAQRIWSVEDLQHAAAREAARNAKQEELQRINAQIRSSLLVKSTEDLSFSSKQAQQEGTTLDFEEAQQDQQETPAVPELSLDFGSMEEVVQQVLKKKN